MPDFPYWYCSIFGCPYRTQYSKNIKKHLTDVHNWSEDKAEEVVSNFFEAHRSGAKVVCAKSNRDPTYPIAPTVEGREGSLEPDRSVSVRSVRGGGGE